ncbi:AbgT family transporter [Corynebacterium hindlerae]|uniref:AbgT family transporter n=1 Tax=Corynebacterium hindlerae TaxID=699041 RepID=A0A7G5FE02_9CORY|nr:AbgT family transporter [Corynebacterium hindlerae]QMV84843.1 AbgT family transporter [Corynebacterium hindlerae]QTH59273.1 AbgT family transporter [Corynebacterium hindlerae]
MSAPVQASTQEVSGGKLIQLAFRSINAIEKWGNKLPHPFWLFCILSVLLIVLSAVLKAMGVTAVNPADGKTIAIKSLLSQAGAEVIIGDVVKNFADFPPLATILTTMLGIVIAERSGLFDAVLRLTVLRIPARFTTFALAYAGMIGHVAGDAAYVTLIPLGGIVFKSLGRSPVLGCIVAFVSVSAGYDASPSITPTDILLSTISTAAIHTMDPAGFMNPTSNYFFSLASSVLVALTITIVVEKVLVKRPDLEEDEDVTGEATTISSLDLSSNERAGIRMATLVGMLFFVALVIAMTIPDSPFRGPQNELLKSPVMEGMAGVIGLFFAFVGFAYGKAAKTYSKLGDVIPAMTEGFKSMAPILVLFFAIAQFLAYFKWTGIGQVLAIYGADIFKQINAPGWAILLGMALVISVMNLILTSGSAMWALAAPVFIPMLMLLGIEPEATQAMYRVADSVTNCVTPMSPYFVMALGFIQSYKKSAGIGTLASFTLPLAGVIWVVWVAFFMIWYLTGIPFGF